MKQAGLFDVDDAITVNAASRNFRYHLARARELIIRAHAASLHRCSEDSRRISRKSVARSSTWIHDAG
jgi:hypothetical protein